MSYNPYEAGQQPQPGGQPGYPQPGGGGGYPQPDGYPQPAGYPQPGGYPPPAGYPQPGGSMYPQPGGYPPAQPGAGYPQPTTEQPQPGGGLMQAPQGGADCPPGLEYLTQVDQLLIKQKVEILEAFTGFETANKYTVKNSLGQKIYFAVEDTDCCTRNCCGPARPFDIKIMDHQQREVIHLDRPLRCQSCCFPCCLQELEVTSNHSLMGMVKQNWSLCGPSFDIMNEGGNTVLKIEGPTCTWSLCGDVSFKVLSADGKHKVGKITKQWTGLVKEAFTDADNFGISFPLDLDVKMKATMLGAAFLIDFMFFEKAQNKETDGMGML